MGPGCSSSNLFSQPSRSWRRGLDAHMLLGSSLLPAAKHHMVRQARAEVELHGSLLYYAQSLQLHFRVSTLSLGFAGSRHYTPSLRILIPLLLAQIIGRSFLAFHRSGLSVSYPSCFLISEDWILSLAPPFTLSNSASGFSSMT